MDLSSALGIITNSLNGTSTTTEKPDLSVTGSAKKRAKKVVDPDAPKKPTTSYFSFAAEERGRVREERESEGLPPLSNAEMTLAIAGRWNALDDKGKEPWSKLYKTQMAQYQEELNTYLAKKGQNDDLTATKATPSKTPTKASIKTPTKTPTKSKPVAKSVVKAVLNPEVSSSDSSSSSSSSSSDNDSSDSSNNSSDSSDDSDESSDDEIDQSLLNNLKVKAMVDTIISKRPRKEEVAVPAKEKNTVKDQKRKKSKTVE